MSESEPSDSKADGAMSTVDELMSESHEPHMADASDTSAVDPSTADELMSESHEPHMADASDTSAIDASTANELMSESHEPHMADASDTSAIDASTANELISESHEPHMADADTMLVVPHVETAAEPLVPQMADAPENSMVATPHVETADATESIEPTTPYVGQTHLENPDDVETADDTAGSMHAADASSDSSQLHVERASESIEHNTPAPSENPHVETPEDTDESTGN